MTTSAADVMPVLVTVAYVRQWIPLSVEPDRALRRLPRIRTGLVKIKGDPTLLEQFSRIFRIGVLGPMPTSRAD